MRFLSKKNIGDGVEVLHTTPGASFTLTAVDDNGRPTGCCNPDIVKASHELVNEILPKDGTIDGVKDVIITLCYKFDEQEKLIAKMQDEISKLKAMNMQLSQSNQDLINQYNWNSVQRKNLKGRLMDLQEEVANLVDYKENFSDVALQNTKLKRLVKELQAIIDEEKADEGRVFHHHCAKNYFGTAVKKSDMVKYLDIMYELATETDKGEYIISNKTDITALYIIMNKKNVFSKPKAFVDMWNTNVLTRIGDEIRRNQLTIENTYITSAKSKAPFNKYGGPASWNMALCSGEKIEKAKVLERSYRIKKSWDEKMAERNNN